MPAHDRGHVVAASKQAGYGIAACVQCPAVGIGAQTDAAAERARINGHSVVGRTRDPAQAWIRTLVRIAVVAVKVRRSFAKLFVIPRLGKPIMLCHCVSQPRGVHADLAGELIERRRFNKIFPGDEPAQAAASRRDAAETVFVNKLAVAHEPGRNGRHVCVRAVHPDDEFVV